MSLFRVFFSFLSNPLAKTIFQSSPKKKRNQSFRCQKIVSFIVTFTSTASNSNAICRFYRFFFNETFLYLTLLCVWSESLKRISHTWLAFCRQTLDSKMNQHSQSRTKQTTTSSYRGKKICFEQWNLTQKTFSDLFGKSHFYAYYMATFYDIVSVCLDKYAPFFEIHIYGIKKTLSRSYKLHAQLALNWCIAQRATFSVKHQLCRGRQFSILYFECIQTKLPKYRALWMCLFFRWHSVAFCLVSFSLF